ncbi:hypothetical protein HRR83_006264 [Exophiala dermatitidis]|uniref:HAUS augmin-like complex subunit 1 n=2 Tax=Exophiala dermatitidis TaxID=5970 RepID=H6C4Y0_EXODN|nr:uncharacterized protein HMPREF1120_06566 [Exophiala dermatitidis NIH/UT8656]KAJ4507292.1 hypothetical protein HRR75_006641 [Exophiala dermatitidis]EHY58557.1 hypothetical protein HMPREF1120_06566 [Exophiala dermatitidis NIH/UT8656]KAJ4509269.1 hypothetical protein HRR73_007123 [Exophiala dermatitidis]KAJ4509456.1 hypothetical protein HRR74_007237 [Exophiala dermatitidis]KAJ4530453.1 hypothetical protein HRR76_008164 [Exophiala dermatitidis]
MQASPSKARADALEAHSWSLVQSWLSDLYHPSPAPYVERNAATLKALQNLMAENIAADHVRGLVAAAQKEELGTAGPRPTLDGESLSRLLESSLPPPSKQALESLAKSAVLLGCPLQSDSDPPSSIEALQSRILNLTREMFDLETQITSIDELTSTLNRQISHIQQATANFVRETVPSSDNNHLSASTSSPPESASFPLTSALPIPLPTTPTTTETAAADHYARLHEQTLQHQRETKQLAIKCAEYKDRIAALERQAAAQESQGGGKESDLVAALLAKKDSLRRKRALITVLESRIRAFHGLPPDLEASRAEVNRAQAELDDLKRERDARFERLGGALDTS